MYLGIDIGTTSVKVSLRDSSPQTNGVAQTKRLTSTKAYVYTGCPERAEQDVNLIFQALERILNELPEELLSSVKHIGVCGQMHGCMVWKAKSSECPSCYTWSADSSGDSQNAKKIIENTSFLITWEDRRCTNDFLATLPVSKQCAPLSSGFGCASLFWLAKNQPDLLQQFDKSGTVQDFLVAMLCDLDKPVMSVHNAVSWGYFDVNTNNWETNLLKEAGFPISFLPEVREPGYKAGCLVRDYFGIPVGTPVGVALGDFQCSVLASISSYTDAVLNIGTSSQLAVVIPDIPTRQAGRGVPKFFESNTPTIQLLPFFKGRKVATSASLTGGNAIAEFVSMLQNWISSLGLEPPPEDVIYERLCDCAHSNLDTSLDVVPTIWGERHATESSGRVTNIRAENLTLGKVAAALYKGVLTNLESMMSSEFLRDCSIQRIVGTGSVLLRNPVMQDLVEQVFGLPVVVASALDACDASDGAILANLLATEGDQSAHGAIFDA